MNEIERHIQQTTDRLQCIKQVSDAVKRLLKVNVIVDDALVNDLMTDLHGPIRL